MFTFDKLFIFGNNMHATRVVRHKNSLLHPLQQHPKSAMFTIFIDRE